MAQLYLQIWMIINAYLRKQRLRKMHRDSTWCANPLCRSLGSFATPWDIKITTELRDSRPLANPLGSSPGRFAKKRESALMPLSPGNIFCYKPPIKPVGSPWGCPGVYPLGWPLIPAWTAMKYPCFSPIFCPVVRWVYLACHFEKKHSFPVLCS